ncbi:MAG: glycosyl hydrolase family protein [Bacteroidetes bacterium]|nr:MAG: glycosyl hydrolase family protein [Bacteroidota bacterium]
MYKIFITQLILLLYFTGFAQILQDDFEGNSTIDTWYADDCFMDISFANPFVDSINPSATVLKYHDTGGLYANVRFNSPSTIYISEGTPFSLKIYVPSEGITGNQPNQISLKLQNNNLSEPWSTQSEIIKPISLDQWQVVTFDFVTDSYINLDPNSPPPNQRNDFNRVVLQVNGENNTDHVIAYIDDFYFEGEEPEETDDPVYDKLVWYDEFETDGALDASKWHHQTLLPNGDSWFNNEIQHYTDRLENTWVEDGVMYLVAKKETFTDQGVTKQYTSARLNSKFAFTYGRVEVKAKLPTGAGTWPAIWTLGKNINEIGAYWYIEGYGTTNWPACGEIDIMEHWGTNQNFVLSAIHTPSSYGGTVNHGGQVIPAASTDFHVYALDWYPDRMVFSVDGVVHYTYNPQVQNDDTWPFYEDQYLLLNIAIEPGIDPNFTESAMEIEYVRIYQESTVSAAEVAFEPKLIVSPNPVSNLALIRSPAEAKGSSVFIYDLQGRLLKSMTIQSAETAVDMSGWAPGIYLFEHRGKNVNQSYKIIKN